VSQRNSILVKLLQAYHTIPSLSSNLSLITSPARKVVPQMRNDPSATLLNLAIIWYNRVERTDSALVGT
jgi:hypothetical protein